MTVNWNPVSETYTYTNSPDPWPNLSVTQVAQNVAQGTTAPSTAMEGGSALGVTIPVGAISVDSSQIAAMNYQQAMMTLQQQVLAHQAMLQQSIQPSLWGTSNPTESTLGLQSNTESSIQNISTNLSTSTKTKKASSDAYKPVTLTLTGQLKPSTLTKAPAAKSSRSTKPKATPPGFWATPPNTGSSW